MAGVVWLASYPKSGNTWARLVLENLLTEEESPVAINSKKQVITGDTSRQWWLRFYGADLNALEREKILGLRPKMLSYFLGQSEGTICLKTHCANAIIGGHRLIPPAQTAGAIYIIRNPLDIVASLAHFWASSPLKAVRYMADKEFWLPPDRVNVPGFMSSWSNHVLSWTRHEHPRLLVVRYEDMVNEPFEWFAKIAHHVGLTPGDSDLERAIGHTQFDKLRDQEAESGFVEALPGRKFFRQGKAGQWKTELKERFVERILRDQGGVMETFGYYPKGSGLAPESPTLQEDRFPPFDAEMPLVPLGLIYRPVGSAGFNIRL